jgi:hypothetical protein
VVEWSSTRLVVCEKSGFRRLKSSLEDDYGPCMNAPVRAGSFLSGSTT